MSANRIAMQHAEISIRELVEAVVVTNFVILDALWVKGALSYEETLASIRWAMSETQGRGAATTQALLELERAALDGIRAHTTGTHHKWNPSLIHGDQERPESSD
jgi:hypothetical protein